jgi:hypothetical protein
MNTHQQSRHPFQAAKPNYTAMWEANFAWGIIAFAMMLFALAIWAFFSLGWYQPEMRAPVDVPAIENPAQPVPQTDRAEVPAVTPSA